MTRDYTSLPHTKKPYGREWNGASGNFDRTRKPIDTIVLHSTAGTQAGTEAWFNNPVSNVGAHYMVLQNGGVVAFAPESFTVYQAGSYPLNQSSIGIEFCDEGNVNIVRSAELYETGAKLLADISQFYNIPLDREHVKRHGEVKQTFCPGNLDVDKIIARAKEILTPAEEPLHTYQMKPSTFTNMVTKSSEFDELWSGLGLPAEIKNTVGAHRLVYQFINQKIDESRGSVTIEELSDEKQSVWKRDIFKMIGDFFKSAKNTKVTVNTL